MASPRIYTVIPNWNGKDMLGACLDSLMKQSLAAKVIVVDNGSSDGSQALIKKSYPSVQIIELDKNYGFAGGVNAGIKAAMDSGAEFVALFNNDAVADRDWLKHLVGSVESSPDIGIVTSKILRSDRKHLDSTGDFYTTWGLPFPRDRNEIDTGQYDKNTEIFGASGGASLYSVKMLELIGLFDEDFFAYFEDVDISFRAQLAGWKVQYAPKALVYHEVGGTSSKLGDFARYHSSKNFVLLYTKDMPVRLYWQYLPLFTLQWLRWGASSTARGKLWPFLKGWLTALVLLPKTLTKRRQVQQSRTVSVSYIDSMLYHHRPPRPPKIESR